MKATIRKRGILHLVAALALLVCALGPIRGSVEAAGSRYFAETGKTVNDPFLSYWTGHGGLSQQGFPITDAYNEKNDADGKTYLTQYFERARFEYHPENSDPKFKVLLGLLGKEGLAAKYADDPPDSDAQTVPGGGSKAFSETGKTVTRLFLTYWNTHGGLEQQGFPITDAYEEVNDADGQTYVTQYFERARFEYHPESSDPKFKVLLGLVGREVYGLKQGSGGGGGTGGTGGTTKPTPTPSGTTPAPIVTASNSLSIPGWTHVVVATNNVAFFYNATNGHAASARLNPDGSLNVMQRFPSEADGNGAFDPGWDIITPGPYNYLLFYSRDRGVAAVCLMGDNGIVGQCGTFGFEKFWTNISLDRQTGVMWVYSSTNGVRNIARLNQNGSITNFSSVSNYIKATRQTYPIGNGMWLDYDFGTKSGATLSVNKDTGEVKRLQTVPDLGLPWSIIVSNQSSIGFYSASGQASLIGSTALDGSIIKLRSYSAPSTITQIASGLFGSYINYSTSTGEITIDKIAQDGTATNLQRYLPSN
ncbi:MAG: hypothetical protein ABI670_00025 [Chloroflexota bacterium]